MNKVTCTIEQSAGSELAKRFPNIFNGEELLLDLDTIKKLAALIKIGGQMRDAQERFARTKSDKSLGDKKRLEAMFDNLVKDLKRLTEKPAPPSNTLF